MVLSSTDFLPPSGDGKKMPTAAVVGIVLAAVSLVFFLVLGILLKRGCLGSKSRRDQGEKNHLQYIFVETKKAKVLRNRVGQSVNI